MTTIVKNKKYLKNRTCPITYDSLEEIIKGENDFVIKLNCGHCFSYRGFIKAYIIDSKHVESHNRCPYCMSKINKIPIIINKYLKKS